MNKLDLIKAALDSAYKHAKDGITPTRATEIEAFTAAGFKASADFDLFHDQFTVHHRAARSFAEMALPSAEHAAKLEAPKP